ncbi:MAG TPA: hypothetical protein VHB46_01690 [Burkholderiales bacterium]|nr:hypothetical protein [Burkholderiales bacterium]
MTFDRRATFTNERTYVLRLHRDAVPADGRLAGQLEHVPSGRRYRFASADELITCLTAAAIAADEPPPPHHPSEHSP